MSEDAPTYHHADRCGVCNKLLEARPSGDRLACCLVTDALTAISHSAYWSTATPTAVDARGFYQVTGREQPMRFSMAQPEWLYRPWA